MGKRINLAGFIAATLAVASIQAKAVELDLRTAGASGTINGAFFDQINPQSTGTGVLDPFLRIQANDQEQGYNSNAAPLDDKSGTWTHDLLLSSLGAVDYKDVDCYQFVLDINENTGSNNELLSLDSVKIYTSTTPNQSVALGSLIGTLRYDLDTGGDNAILLDYSLNSGKIGRAHV